MKPTILLLDIETSPLLIYAWGMYQVDAIDVAQDYYILSCSMKWLGEKKTECRALKDFPLYKKDPRNDKALLEWIGEKLTKADIVIAHNGDEFDLKKIRARFLFHRMLPPAPYTTIDTLKVLRSGFACTSNKLSYIANFLGVGTKQETGGFGLWKKVMQGDMKAWAKMVAYNKNDVILLEKIYLVLRPWIKNHPNMGVFSGRMSCTACSSENTIYNGYYISNRKKYRRVACLDCGKYSKDYRSISTEQTLVNI